MDAVSAAIVLKREKPLQALGRQVAGNAGWVNSGSGRCDGAAVNVCCKNLYLVVLTEHVEPLLQQYREGISLFARRAAGTPDAKGTALRLAFKKPGDNLGLQRLKGQRVTEELRHTNQQIPKKGFDLDGCLLQVFDVIPYRGHLMYCHSALNAAVNGAGFVLRKIVA